ncbi:MAG TPA: carbohydrate ABC transporter permease [Candidatus Limiplasma sp.]|nr:carbohydrate ABC transporter permease [Candidatus Limiplasma sp.]HRX08347.1 carbohydrate ABC transporter permease [Candidatus Limiplasma sp.]
MNSVNRNRKITETVFTIIALIVTAISLFPLLWMIVSAFKPAKEVLKANPLRFFPSVWDFSNLQKLFEDTSYPFLTAMKSSSFVAVIAALMAVTINSMAAYAYARLDFRFKKLLWRTTIFTMYIPGITILVTSFVVVNSLGMLDSYAVLILPGLASAYSIFFFRQFFLNMPMATEEAALIDGASRFRIFLSIFIPNAKSPYVIIGTGAFLGYWNSFLWPAMTVTSPQYMQVMQVIRSYNNMYSNNYGVVLAGSAIAALPPILVFLLFQRHIVKGLMISGIK